jgi:hypothetical protein
MVDVRFGRMFDRKTALWITAQRQPMDQELEKMCNFCCKAKEPGTSVDRAAFPQEWAK